MKDCRFCDKEYVKKGTIYRTDNFFVKIKGATGKKSLAILAHMDEIGGTIRKIKKDGSLEFSKRGGYEGRWLVSKTVKILNKDGKWISGVIKGRSAHATPDKLRIKELLHNIIDNSVKYTKDTGIITFDMTNDDDFVIFSIKDNGIGMTKEQIKKMFDEFYKADTSRHDFDSSGLGMSICKRIVEKHGGKICAVYAMVMTIPYMFKFHRKLKHKFVVKLYVIERKDK